VTPPLDPPQAPKTAGSLHSEPAEPVLGLPLHRANALLPSNLIQGDETIILLLKPSPWYIVLSSLEALIVIGLVTAVMLWVRHYFQLQAYKDDGMIALALGLAAVRLGWQAFDWVCRLYVLTDRRIVSIEGVLRVQVFQAELRNLQHTNLFFSLRERLLGLGTISFSTSGTAWPEAYWLMLRRPYAVHRRVIQAMHRYR
jgi:hypothetical protein